MQIEGVTEMKNQIKRLLVFCPLMVGTLILTRGSILTLLIMLDIHSEDYKKQVIETFMIEELKVSKMECSEGYFKFLRINPDLTREWVTSDLLCNKED